MKILIQREYWLSLERIKIGSMIMMIKIWQSEYIIIAWWRGEAMKHLVNLERLDRQKVIL